jgi:hypothetical protein
MLEVIIQTMIKARSLIRIRGSGLANSHVGKKIRFADQNNAISIERWLNQPSVPD